MKLVTDAHYIGNQAVVAGVLFDNWDAAEPANEYIVNQNNIADYEPGSFYKRESRSWLPEQIKSCVCWRSRSKYFRTTTLWALMSATAAVSR